jgi:hypothetical protein
MSNDQCGKATPRAGREGEQRVKRSSGVLFFAIAALVLLGSWSHASAQTITSISPSTVTAGGPAFTLTVTGTNFAQGMVVEVNGSPRVTTFVSALQLTAIILATDIASPGVLQITVVSPSLGKPSNPASLTVTPAGPPPPTPPTLIQVGPGFVAQATEQVEITLIGTNFRPGATVVISPPLAALQNSTGKNPAPDVAVLSVTRINSTLMTTLVSIGPTAKPGLRAVDVLNLDGTSTGFVTAGTFAGGSGTSQPFHVQSSNSLGARLSVLTLAVSHPRDGTVVMQGQELNAEAILGGAGTGTVIGQWLWDGNVVEQFTASIVGGQSAAIQTRQSLPTWFLGVHTLQLRMVQPNQIAAKPITIVINPGDWSLEGILAPPYGAMFSLDHPPLLSWSPVPAAAKYQVGFSTQPYFSTIERWYDSVDNRWQVPSQVWHDLPEGQLYWTVRTVEISGVSRKPLPMRSIYRFPDGVLASTQTAPTKTAAGNTLLAWKPVGAGTFYRVTVSQDRDAKQVVRRYLTAAPQVDLRAIDRGLEPGRTYFWQVDAISSSGRLLMSGPPQSFVAGPGPKAGLRGRDGELIQLASLGMPILPSASVDLNAQITKRSPEPNSSVSQQQPVISAEFQSKVNPLDISLTVDDLDVTSMCEVTETKITYTSALPMSSGDHAVNLVVGTEAVSWKFSLSVGAAATATATAPTPSSTSGTPATQSGTDAEVPPSTPATGKAPEGKAPAGGAPAGTPPVVPPPATGWVRQEQISANSQYATGGSPPSFNTLSFAEKMTWDNGPWHADVNGSGMLNSVLNPEAQRTSKGLVNDYLTQLQYKGTGWSANFRFGVVAPVLYTGAQFVAVATPRQGAEIVLATKAGSFGYFVNTSDSALGGGAGITFHQQIMGASWVAPLPAKWAEFRFMWLRAQDVGSPTITTFDTLGHPLIIANPLGSPNKGDVFGGLLTIHLRPTWAWNNEYSWSYDNPNTSDPTSTSLFGRAWRTGIVGQKNKILVNVQYRDVGPNFANPANPGLTAASRADLRGVDASVADTTKAGTFGVTYSFLQNNVRPVDSPELYLHSLNETWSKPFGPKTNLAVTARQSLTQTGTVPASVLLLPVDQQGLQDMRDLYGGVTLSRQVGMVTLSAGGTRDWNRNNIFTTLDTITSALTFGTNWVTKGIFQLNTQTSVNWVAAEKFTIGDTRTITTYLQPNFVLKKQGLQIAPLASLTQGRTLLITGTLTNDTLTGQYGGRIAWTPTGTFKFNTFSVQGTYNQNRNTVAALDMRGTQVIAIWTVTWGHTKPGL